MSDGQLVIAGEFGGPSPKIAKWDGQNWVAFGAGFNNQVNCLASATGTTVFAGGLFTKSGSTSMNYVATWNGAQWVGLGSGTDTPVIAMIGLPPGDLVVGGGFSTAGGVPAKGVARWNGASWSPLGSGIGGVGAAFAMANAPNGDLIVGGSFTSAGGVSANNIGRWNGSAWSALGSGVSGGVTQPGIRALAFLPSNDLIVAGQFSTAGGNQAVNIARWDGSTWSAMGAGLGDFQSAIVRSALLTNTGELMAFGGFAQSGATACGGIARWDITKQNWAPVGSGLTSPIRTLFRTSADSIVAGGTFYGAGDVSTNGIAAFDGKSWKALGLGITNGIGASVDAIAEMGNGDIVAGGGFISAGGKQANHIARWDGSEWNALGQGLNGTVYSLTTRPNGNLLAGGEFMQAGTLPAARTAEWNGVDWSSHGSGLSGTVYSLAVSPNGDFVAGGYFTTAGGIKCNSIARWFYGASSWGPLGDGVSSNGSAPTVYSLRWLQDGSMLAGGDFQTSGPLTVNGLARWDGEKWGTFGTGLVYAKSIEVMPDDSIVAAGSVSQGGGLYAPGVAQWTGSEWVSVTQSINKVPLAIAFDADFTLYVGGEFLQVDSQVSAYLARYGCPTPPPCYPDCDGSKNLDIDDFICFQTLYALNDPNADCDLSGGLDIDDFICFQTFYALGC